MIFDLDDEDSLSIPTAASKTPMPEGQRCAIVRFPRISNTTDFRLLKDASWISAPVDERFDFVFLPGTKNTVADLLWMRDQQLDRWLGAQHRGGATIIGICGGFQMLGEAIAIPTVWNPLLSRLPDSVFFPCAPPCGQRRPPTW